jgi:hypothetical protein
LPQSNRYCITRLQLLLAEALKKETVFVRMPSDGPVTAIPKIISASMPLPVTFTVSLPFIASEKTVITPLYSPRAPGAKVTVTAWFDPTPNTNAEGVAV